MNVLSLFDGMSVAQIALKELGIIPENYYASEIDKYAIAQTQLNFPNTIQLGSITEWKDWDIDFKSIDLICAGSPCQGFSFAGKQLAFDDPRSKLFFVFIDILNHIKELNPNVKFLLENVDMKKEHRRVINEMTGVFGQNINSNLVSAQNRSRWYWHNIKTKLDGFFDEVQCDIPQPKDQGILLRDILEGEVDEKYYLSDKMLNYFDKRAANFNNGVVNIRDENDKASTITASCKSVDISDNFIKVDKQLNKKPDQNKASCFTASGHSGGNHSDMDLIMTKNYAQWNTSGKGYKSQQDRAFYEDGKHGCLSAQRADSKTGVLIQNGHGFNKGGVHEEKCPSITSNSFEHNNHILKESRIRRLTPVEVSRLQTIPAWYQFKFVYEYYYGYICNVKLKTEICKANVVLLDAKEQYQINQRDFATCTILDLLEKEQLKSEKLTKQKNAKLMDVIEWHKQCSTETFVSCITKDFGDTDHLNYPGNKAKRNVSFVIEKSEEEEHSECARVIISVSKIMEIHLLLKTKEKKEKTQLRETDIMDVRIKKKDINQQWRVILGENLKKEKLSTILALINWIMIREIYTYVKTSLNIHLSIGNLNVSDQNYIKMELSDLKMESIIYTSDTQIYRMCGNGWTSKVIEHILFYLEPL